MFSFLEKWIEVDCGENRRPLSQVAESRWILLANIFQRMEFRLARVEEIAGSKVEPGHKPGFLHPQKYFRRVTDSLARYRIYG